MLKRIISLVLCLIMAAAVLASFNGCSTEKDESPSSDAIISETDNAQSSGVEDEDTYVPPDVYYNNIDFNILTWDITTEWVMEYSDTLNEINKQSYYHLNMTEQELGINLNIALKVPGGYGNMESFVTKIYTLSGSDNIDLVCQYSLAGAVGVQQGVYKNLLEVDHIKWDAEYWSEDLLKAHTINNKLYYCTGDLTPTVLETMFVMVYNYDLANKYQMGNLYELVDTNQWTIEKLYELTKGCYLDVNRNGQKDNSDEYGLVSAVYNELDPYQYGGDLECLVVNSVGELEVNSQLYGEYGTTLCKKLRQLLHDNPGAYCNTKENGRYSNAIREGKTVFQVMQAGELITGFTESDVNHGILPMPMYDSDQGRYRTTNSMVYSMFSIPIIARDPNMSAAVLESMAHSGYVKINPAIFKAMQYKYSTRSDDARMLEILRKGISYDPGRYLDSVGLFALVRRVVRDNVEIITYYEYQEELTRNALIEVNLAFS